MHFATYGDAVFEEILQQIETFPLPECIRRLEVEIPDVPATIVGYAVAERDAEGQPRCRLVTSWYDLAALQLDTAAILSEPDVESLRQRLSAMARQEFAMTQAVPRITAINEQAGHAQRLLDYLVARGLLQSRLQTGSAQALFWREVQALEPSPRGMIPRVCVISRPRSDGVSPACCSISTCPAWEMKAMWMRHRRSSRPLSMPCAGWQTA